jgi:putative SOS response-associated peptidase YedK
MAENQVCLKERGFRIQIMCGRFLLESDIDDIIASYEYVKSINSDISHAQGEVFPTDSVPIITQRNELKIVKWGFPFKNSSKGVVNARAESISKKPFFKKAVESCRCIIPANSFYEWAEENNKKVKYRISLKDSALFSLAGIYDVFVDKDNNEYEAFVIITTDANKDMEKIHTRMPVILDKGYEKIWLYYNMYTQDLSDILKPYRNDGLLIMPDNGLIQMSII